MTVAYDGKFSTLWPMAYGELKTMLIGVKTNIMAPSTSKSLFRT